MKDAYHKVVITVMILVIDLYLIHLAFTLVNALEINGDSTRGREATWFFLLFALLWIIADSILRTNRFDAPDHTSDPGVNLLTTFIIHVMMVYTVLSTFDVVRVAQQYLLAVYLIAGMLIVASRVIFRWMLRYFETASFNEKKIIIVGATPSGRLMHKFFVTHPGSGYRFLGFFDDHAPKSRVYRKLMGGKLDAIKDFCLREKVEEIFFALPPTRKDLLEDLLKFADDNFIYFRIVPDFATFVRGNCDLSLMNSIPVLTASRNPEQTSPGILQRVGFRGFQKQWRGEKVHPSMFFDRKASVTE